MFILTLAATIAATAFGYIQTRAFFRRRLAYVDAAHGVAAPFLAAGAAFLLALPVVGVLPLIGTGTALLFGAGVGAGASAGSKDARYRRISA